MRQWLLLFCFTRHTDREEMVKSGFNLSITGVLTFWGKCGEIMRDIGKHWKVTYVLLCARIICRLKEAGNMD